MASPRPLPTPDPAACADPQVLVVLEECAASHKSGYLSAFPASFLDRLEDISPVWAPYYTLHKLLAGLLQVPSPSRTP